MATLRCWDVDCQVDGVVTEWADIAPTLCPVDSGHTLNGVGPTAGGFNGGQPVAHQAIYMDDGAGRVYKMTIDSNGGWVATQLAGPAP